MQSKRQSFIEAMVNVFSGMVIAFSVTQLAAPSLGADIPIHSNIVLTIILTVVSVIRGYLWRRFFNKRHKHIEV